MSIRMAKVVSLQKLRKFVIVGGAVSALAGAPLAQAQNFDRPPADVEDGARGSDTSSLLRLDRLENQVRALNGQVEQLQFQNRKLEDQLRKFQMDVDSRFQDSAGHGGRSTPQRRTDAPEAEPMAPPQQSAQTAPAPTASAPSRGRHDAFDPDAQPSVPGAPMALGSPGSASKPGARRDPNGPLDLTPPGVRDQAPAPEAGGSMASLEPNGGTPPALPPADPVKAEYEAATEQLRSQHYDAAQQGFASFVQKNPHSRMIAPAIYHLGESYYYQNRHREAAEQFLKIATDYSKSSVAPDAMIKLGVSLNALGAKEQACAFFSELPRKYPNASAAEKTAAAREAKKASC